MRNRRTGARGWRHTDIHKVVGVRIDITTKTLGGGCHSSRADLSGQPEASFFFPNHFIIFRVAQLFCAIAAPRLTRVLLVD